MRSKKALANIITSVIQQIISIICGFIVPRLIIESFGSSVNGLLVSITQFLTYITLLESGFGPVVKSILFKPIANKDKSQIEDILKASERFFRIVSYIFIAYILILCFILPSMVSAEFDTMFTVSLILIISISTFAEYFFGMTYGLYISAEQKTYIISTIQIVTLIINAAAIVVLIKVGASIQIVKLISCLIFVVRPFIQNIYVKKKYGINLKNSKNKYKIKEKWDGLAQHVAYVVHHNTDVVILTMCTNVMEVSVYSVYASVTEGVKNLVQAFTRGIDASFGDMIAKGEQDTLNRSFRIYELIYFTITAITGSMLFLLTIPFVKLYTSGITDVNYIRPEFAVILIIAKLLLIVRRTIL